MENEYFQLFDKSISKAKQSPEHKELNFNVVYLFQMIHEDRAASKIDFSRFSIEDIDSAFQLLEGNAIYLDDDYEMVELQIDELEHAVEYSGHEYIVKDLFNDKKHSRFKEARRIFI
ncbi:hypothetical protein ACH0B6_17075 [Solibacillus silvestris]